MSCGVGCRQGLDPELLCLWWTLVAIALIRPLAQEPPYAMGWALEKAKRQKKKNQQKENKTYYYVEDNEVHRQNLADIFYSMFPDGLEIKSLIYDIYLMVILTSNYL